MAIRYVSEFDSPEDPGGLIKQALDMGEEFPGPAEDIILAWTIRLDPALEPAVAAQRLLKSYSIEEGDPPETEAGRLVTLLRQVGQSGLSHGQAKKRRRRNTNRRSLT